MSDQVTASLLEAPQTIAVGKLSGPAVRMKRHDLVVRQAVKRYALDYAAAKRRLSTGQPRFTRVSEDFVDRMSAKLRQLIGAEIDRLPSCGRTIT